MIMNLFFEFVCLSCLTVIVVQCGATHHVPPRLIMLFTLSRHGDRTPINVIHGDPYRKHWTSGYAQLTVTGAAQLVELGQFVRNRYGAFIPPTYHKDKCFFRSSGTHRTLMSANSFIRGLYHSEQEKSDYVPPPVFSTSENEDHLLKMSQNCPAYRDTVHTLMSTDQVSKKVASFANTLKELQMEFPQMYKLPPDSMNLLRPSWEICDHVSIWIRHKLPNRPTWLTERVVSDCHDLITYKMSTFYSTLNLRRFRGGPLAAHLVRLLRIRANAELDPDVTLPNPLPEPLGLDLMEPVNQKMLLVSYFAHDSTLSALMSHFGIFNKQIPPLASCLLVELHRVSQPADQPFEEFFVRFAYRNFTGLDLPVSEQQKKKPILLWPPACGPKDLAVEQDYLCSLTVLESTIRGTYLLKSQPEQCYSHTDSDKVMELLITPDGTMHLFVLTIILVQFFLIFCLFHRLRLSGCKLRTVHVRTAIGPVHSHRISHAH